MFDKLFQFLLLSLSVQTIKIDSKVGRQRREEKGKGESKGERERERELSRDREREREDNRRLPKSTYNELLETVA